jgi:WD40 repeat protein
LVLRGRIDRAPAQVFLLGLGAAALATPMLITHVPALPGNHGGRTAAADLSRLNVGTPRLDRFGDPLPPRAIMRLGTTQRRHTRRVAGLDFTPDGKTVLTAQDDGLVRFWNPENGRQVRSIDMMASATSRDKSLRDFAVSPDGKLMAAAGFALDPVRRRIMHRVWIWDLNNDQARRAIDVPAVDLFCMAFAPDGAAIATGGFAGQVQLWDVASGACLKTLKLGNSSVHSLSFARDGKVVAVCEPGQGARLYDLDRDRETFLADSQCTMIAPVFSADGRWMAINSRGGEATLWDRTTGQRHLTAQGVAVAFAPDCRTLATSVPDGRTLQLIDTGNGSELWKIEAGDGQTTPGVAFSPDGKTIITASGGTLRFFESGSGRERFASSEAHVGGINAVQYLPNGRALLTAGADGTVRQWDAVTARQLRVYEHDGRVQAISVSRDGASFATAAIGPQASVSVWEPATGVRRQQWPGAEVGDGAQALAFSSDGRSLLVFDDDHGLRVLDIATGEEREAEQPSFSLELGGTGNTGIGRGVFAPGNQFLAITTPTTASVVDLATGEERWTAPCLALAFSVDGESLVVASPGKPEMSQLADGSYRTMGPVADAIERVDLGSEQRTRIEIPRESVTALAVSPDGKAVAVAGGWISPTVRLYRTSDGREIQSFPAPARISQAGALAFSLDGRRLAAGLDDTTVVIWDVRDVQ